MLARKALAGTAAAPKVYVEDVFSTYLYTGNGSTQTITNNIDLSGEGGLVWIKQRTDAAHALYDTVRGVRKAISSNSTLAELTASSGNELTAFNSNGFSLGTDSNYNVNSSSTNYASFTFRKAKKFFDVVTYTGNGALSRDVSHNLGSTPGFIIVKKTDGAAGWYCWHNSFAADDHIILNSTAAKATTNVAFGGNTNKLPTSTTFTVGNNGVVNGSGETYVAYLFAHDAGGFGDAGDQSVIKCGSFTGGSPATVDLGWEPQWVIIKSSTNADNWYIFDTMRGWTVDYSGLNYLKANTSDAEATGSTTGLRSNGFVFDYGSGQTFIYIAIRRGPMKTPTTGTSVYNSAVFSGNDGTQTYSNGFPTDFILHMTRNAAGYSRLLCDRLRGKGPRLNTASTDAESNLDLFNFDRQNSVSLTSAAASVNASGTDYTQINLRRAPGFFDVVCYTGNGSYGRTISHNLGVAPELLIVKQRSLARGWAVYAAPLGATEALQLHLSDAKSTSDWFANTTPTSSVFSVGSNQIVNENSQTFVAYLFASVTGVSKVGSYTGNGSSVTVTTGFQPRFILVKRTDSTGNWIVSDSARGLVAGNDPYLLLNSTAAEDTDEDWVDVSSTGFTVNQVTASNANVNTGTYIYLAIA